jgi:signal transduction histidine kinase
VVQTLVDLSRPVELRLQEQDLRKVVSAVLMLASVELETHDVHVESDLPAYPVPVKVDTDMLKQALLNVVLNGAQAMVEGGKMAVRLTENGRAASIAIRDQGSGIPPEIMDKIFDLYFTTKKEGSGIGLAMTYRILQLHNGSVEVESDGTGTTFTLRIPLHTAQEMRVRGSLAAAGNETIGPAVAKETRE